MSEWERTKEMRVGESENVSSGNACHLCHTLRIGSSSKTTDMTLSSKFGEKIFAIFLDGITQSSIYQHAGLIWLQNRGDSVAAAASLYGNASTIGLLDLWEGVGVAIAGSGDPATDPRVPDVVIQTVPGVIFTSSKTKIAEHGGFNEDDLHVLLVAHNPRFHAKKVSVPVQTAQIAPSILTALGLNPEELEAVVIEGTSILPELF
ncbi:hypothetical protein BC937DRAFT_94798 [Endogone sp. FLAS-F59071]|nr:hypothetical protein BC937DRAFT_94798 [Endogone sp. FLAS-F59071]|eukprot:RUS22944.1 hypothetical protein BC937DRAFT_94798 [Endogone sp. FLAS-F59071]